MAYKAPTHALNQRWLIVHWTIEKKMLRIFDQNTITFIRENTFENQLFYSGLNVLIFHL